MAVLRDYQSETLAQIREAIGQGLRRVMVQMPTGSGKTRLAAEIVNGAHGKKKRVVFTVPAISLIDQTVEAFYAEGISDVGVIQSNHHMTDWSRPIQIASLQTLMERGIPEADVVLQDEAHKLFKFVLRWMTDERWRAKRVPFIGLSATPWTRGLGKLYERLIVGTTMKELIEKQHLVPFRVLAPTDVNLKVDLTKVRTTGGDYNGADLSVAVNKPKLVGDIVETWQRHAEGRPTICFAVDRAHADALCKRFCESGVPAEYMDCNTPTGQRNEIRRRLERGATKVVCNVEVIGIGVDWPLVACISYCRPTKSEMRFVQNIGRGLRPFKGKTDLLILDHSDTHLRLGFVTDINRDKMHMGREAVEQPRRVPLPKQCPKCGYLKPYMVRLCSQCGFETAPPPPIKEYTGADLAAFDGKKTCGKKEKFTDAEKAIFYAELKAYGLSKGYKDGWASNKYRTRFGVWPNNGVAGVAPAADISVATRKWIQSQNIAWAKSKNNSGGQSMRAAYAAYKQKEVVQDKSESGFQHNAMPASDTGERPAQAFVPGTLCTEQDMEDFR